MADNFKYDVFLSHNQSDKPKVRRLAERLKVAGINVWLDEWIIKAGDIITLKVDEGLEQSRVLLLCITPAALASGWVALERSTAIHRDPANEGRRFIPLFFGDCELPASLSKYKYVDYRNETEAAFAEVLNTCQAEKEETNADLSLEADKKSGKKRPKAAKSSLVKAPLAVLVRKFEKFKTSKENWFYKVTPSKDGKWLAFACHDSKVLIFDLQKEELYATLEGHQKDVFSVAFMPDSKHLLSGSLDRTILVWDVLKKKQIKKLDGHLRQVLDIATSTDEIHAFSSSGNSDHDGQIFLWNIKSGKSVWSSEKILQLVSGVDITRNAELGISGSYDNTVRVWDIKTGIEIRELKGHTAWVTDVIFSPDESTCISSSHDCTIKIWDFKKGVCIGTLEGHSDEIQKIAISSDGVLLASIDYYECRIWEVSSGRCLQIIKYNNRLLLNSIEFFLDNSHLIIGTHQGTCYIYKFESNRLISSHDKTKRYVNAKVVLLGEGTVGKTSLAHRLIDDEYVIKDRTHGMNVWRMELPLPANDMLEREALLWDLAGQEDYRLIHQLFLDQTALALLLINPQKEDPFAEAGDWLKALKTASDPESKNEASRLLIFSQTDVGGMKLGNAKIDRFKEQHGFADWLSTSAKTGENCSDNENGDKPSNLKQLIAKNIPWDKLPWTSTPLLLSELKNTVMAMRDESDIRLMRFSELAQRLEQALPGEKIAEADVRTAVTLLANHGLARPLKFGDLVLLRPDLINGYAGAVIRAARANLDEIGSVREADIYMADFDFTGVERLTHRPDEELLLRALVQTFLDHSLCIAEDLDDGRHLVFPSQYRREKDIPHEPDIFVSYSFSGEWQTVWTTLVVRLWYSQEFAHTELWRNAAEFKSASEQTLGLKIMKTGDGTATISLYFDIKVPDDLKVIFIEYVHRHLARYGCDVVRDRRYICPECSKPVTDLKEVRKRLAGNKDFIYCQGCDEKVPLIDLIEKRLKSDPVARKILAMEQIATRELDTQALEQILIGHMMAIAGEANQVFRELTKFDYGIDGEVEFKDNDGRASGKKIYIQLKSGNSYLRNRKNDGNEIFDVKDERHLEYWVNQPVDVFLVIRQKDEMRNDETIRWMNVTEYLNNRKDKKSKQIIFNGEKLDATAIWKLRDKFFPPAMTKA